MVNTRRKKYITSPSRGTSRRRMLTVGSTRPTGIVAPAADIMNNDETMIATEPSPIFTSSAIDLKSEPEVMVDSTLQTEAKHERQTIATENAECLSEGTSSKTAVQHDCSTAETPLNTPSCPAGPSSTAVLDEGLDTGTNTKEDAKCSANADRSKDAITTPPLITDHPELCPPKQDPTASPPQSNDTTRVDIISHSKNKCLQIEDTPVIHAYPNRDEEMIHGSVRKHLDNIHVREDETTAPAQDISHNNRHQDPGSFAPSLLCPEIDNHDHSIKSRRWNIAQAQDEDDETDVDETDPHVMLAALRKKGYIRQSNRLTQERKLHSGIVLWASEEFETKQTRILEDILIDGQYRWNILKSKLASKSFPKVESFDQFDLSMNQIVEDVNIGRGINQEKTHALQAAANELAQLLEQQHEEEVPQPELKKFRDAMELLRDHIGVHSAIMDYPMIQQNKKDPLYRPYKARADHEDNFLKRKRSPCT